MINLLPATSKQQLRAARANIVLINYLILLGFAVVFLVAACFISYLFLVDAKTTAEKIINNQSITIAKPSSANNSSLMNIEFTNAKIIIGQQVSYSEIIMNIGNILPEGVIIDSLLLNSNTLNSPVTINAHAKSYDNTAILKTNFQNSAQFSNFSIKSQVMNQNGLSGYPVEFSFEVTINRGVK